MTARNATIIFFSGIDNNTKDLLGTKLTLQETLHELTTGAINNPAEWAT